MSESVSPDFDLEIELSPREDASTEEYESGTEISTYDRPKVPKLDFSFLDEIISTPAIITPREEEPKAKKSAVKLPPIIKPSVTSRKVVLKGPVKVLDPIPEK